jgi:PleD family two-component response regulator
VIRLSPPRNASQPPDPNDKPGVPQRLTPPARTALVVDDEPDIGQLLAEMLQKLGYRIEVTVSGEAAQVALTQRDYDVVL